MIVSFVINSWVWIPIGWTVFCAAVSMWFVYENGIDEFLSLLGLLFLRWVVPVALCVSVGMLASRVVTP